MLCRTAASNLRQMSVLEDVIFFFFLKKILKPNLTAALKKSVSAWVESVCANMSLKRPAAIRPATSQEVTAAGDLASHRPSILMPEATFNKPKARAATPVRRTSVYHQRP